MHYEHRNAYRHQNSEVEGFVGTGDSKAKAKADAIEQIKRKLDLVAGLTDDSCFDKARVVESPSTLSRDELEIVQTDWRSGLRY